MSLPGVPNHLQIYARFFVEAGKKNDLDPYLLASICQQESGGDSGIVGYDKHGHGLMQVDDRYHKDFVRSGDWRDAWKNISKGAEILSAAIKEFAGDTDAEFLGTCRYNASMKRISEALGKANADKISRRMAADSVTTGGNYGSKVFNRRASYLAKAVLA